MKALPALFWAFNLIGLFVVASAASQPVEQSTVPPLQGNNLEPLLEEQRTTLQHYGLASIIVSRGERVGDTFDPDTMNLIAGVDDCFPGLQPRRAASQLPTVTGESAKGLAAAFGVAGVVDAGGSGGRNRSFELSFKEVKAVTASVVQLRDALRRGVPECNILRPYLTSATRASDLPQPPLLIKTVFMARRVVRVSTSNYIGTKASLGEELLRLLGVASSFKMSAESSQTEQSMIELVGEDIVPVAYSPAFIRKSQEVAFIDNGRIIATTIDKIVEVDPGSEEFQSNAQAALQQTLN